MADMKWTEEEHAVRLALDQFLRKYQRIVEAAALVCAAAKADDDDTSAPDLHSAIAELEELL